MVLDLQMAVVEQTLIFSVLNQVLAIVPLLFPGGAIFFIRDWVR